MSKEPLNINEQSIVLVGLMGAGKSSVGRILARHLALPFIDSDDEVEKAAGCSIEDIFELYGEPAFRDVEKRVIERLLNEGPHVLATGGGAFMNPDTRNQILKKGISVWLRAELDVLVRRTKRRGGRPLLKDTDPSEKLQALMADRYPIYGEAEITIDSRDEPAEVTAARILEHLTPTSSNAPSTPSREI